MRPEALAVALAIGLATACGKGSPSELPQRTCRRYATSLTINGQGYDCDFGGTGYHCRGPQVAENWTYRSLSDFVLEAQIPNRRRVLRQEGSWYGWWAWMGSGGDTTEYRYDGAGRLKGRTRTSYSSLGGGPQSATELDSIEYTSWDARGRPASGILSAGGESETVVLMYDDAARHMEASNGESVTLDANGNTVREVVVFGFGSPGVREHVVQATAEVCLEP